MKLKEFNIVLDIRKSNKPSKIEVVQSDNETNILNISLVDGINKYDINSNVQVVYLKPDDSIYIQNDVEVVENKIRCTLTNEILDTHGDVLSEVRLLKENIIMTIGQIEIYVRKSIH